MLAFDIETDALPEDYIRSVMPPYKPGKKKKPPGEFDPDAVKLGNTKAHDKIIEIVERGRKKHAVLIADFDKSAKEAEVEYWEQIIDKAALSPITGHILAIGYHSTEKGNTVIVMEDDKITETLMLELFWKQYLRCFNQPRKMIGHNVIGFDFPFVINRSWILGVEVPTQVFDGRYLDRTTIGDTMLHWTCGQHGKFIKLDTICRAMGVKGKMEGMDGKDFGRVFREDREKAEAYLLDDVMAVVAVAQRQGFV